MSFEEDCQLNRRIAKDFFTHEQAKHFTNRYVSLWRNNDRLCRYDANEHTCLFDIMSSLRPARGVIFSSQYSDSFCKDPLTSGSYTFNKGAVDSIKGCLVLDGSARSCWQAFLVQETLKHSHYIPASIKDDKGKIESRFAWMNEEQRNDFARTAFMTQAVRVSGRIAEIAYLTSPIMFKYDVLGIEVTGAKCEFRKRTLDIETAEFGPEQIIKTYTSDPIDFERLLALGLEYRQPSKRKLGYIGVSIVAKVTCMLLRFVEILLAPFSAITSRLLMGLSAIPFVGSLLNYMLLAIWVVLIFPILVLATISSAMPFLLPVVGVAFIPVILVVHIVVGLFPPTRSFKDKEQKLFILKSWPLVNDISDFVSSRSLKNIEAYEYVKSIRKICCGKVVDFAFAEHGASSEFERINKFFEEIWCDPLARYVDSLSPYF